MNRRAFIKTGCTACLAVSVLPLVVSSCSTLTSATGKLVKDGITLNVDDFKIADKVGSAYRSFLVVRNDALKYPICVYKLPNNQYSALWMKCSHQGAELQASGDYLQCPAHGSEFNNKGLSTSGPANSNLRSFPVTVNDKEIFIDLRKQS
jgi:nitrite reductase/ring-hydroxylating ferredoxin subunit